MLIQNFRFVIDTSRMDLLIPSHKKRTSLLLIDKNITEKSYFVHSIAVLGKIYIGFVKTKP